MALSAFYIGYIDTGEGQNVESKTKVRDAAPWVIETSIAADNTTNDASIHVATAKQPKSKMNV